MISCLNPVEAFDFGVKSNGKRRITFSPSEALDHAFRPRSLLLPCGRCTLCRHAKRVDLTCRLVKECSQFDDISFLTLTYDDQHLPINDQGFPTLRKRDIQLFLKRLRRHLSYHYGLDHLRFAAAGEYGKRGRRPHWHLMIFGWLPSDLFVWQHKPKYDIYRSPTIESLWPFGFSTVGRGNGAVGRYCAKYITKDGLKVHASQTPECFWSSRRDGGLGAPYWDKFFRADLRRGYVLSLSHGVPYKFKIPPYFVSRSEKLDSDLFADFKARRLQYMLDHIVTDPHQIEQDFADLIARSKVYDLHSSLEVRSFENS